LAIEVVVTRRFEADFDRLQKSYPRIGEPVLELMRRLQAGQRPGQRLSLSDYSRKAARRFQQLAGQLYKVRLPAPSLARGKSGGHRAIYLWQAEKSQCILLTLYTKAEIADLSAAELAALLQELSE